MFAEVAGQSNWLEGTNYLCPLEGHARKVPSSPELYFWRFSDTNDLAVCCSGKHADLGPLNFRKWCDLFDKNPHTRKPIERCGHPTATTDEPCRKQKLPNRDGCEDHSKPDGSRKLSATEAKHAAYINIKNRRAVFIDERWWTVTPSNVCVETPTREVRGWIDEAISAVRPGDHQPRYTNELLRSAEDKLAPRSTPQLNLDTPMLPMLLPPTLYKENSADHALSLIHI